MKPHSYRIDIVVFGKVAVAACKDTHYHADCAASLTAALTEARAKTDTGDVVLDLSGVRLFSSSALRAVRAAHVAGVKEGGRIVAAGGGELAVNVLKFAPFIEHFETVHEALAVCSPDAAAAHALAEDKT